MPVCEICNNANFIQISSRIREGKGRTIIRCSQCGLTMQDSVVDMRKIRDYYKTEYQITNSLVSGEILSPKENFEIRLQTIRPVFKEVKKILGTKSKVLEIGCGSGALLSLINPYVDKCVGIELYPPFIRFIKKQLSIRVYAGDINTLNLKDKFDLIICISTLDHLPNPLETLFTMKRLLSRKGRIYIEVPNAGEALNNFIPIETRRKFNYFFWHKAHFFYFTKDTISYLFKKAGLEIKVKCRHDYTLKNFFNWYFLGKPQRKLLEAMGNNIFFKGKSDFEVSMNRALLETEREFKKVMAKTYCGSSLCCTGWMR